MGTFDAHLLPLGFAFCLCNWKSHGMNLEKADVLKNLSVFPSVTEPTLSRVILKLGFAKSHAVSI